jgi:hypothetical protein
MKSSQKLPRSVYYLLVFILVVNVAVTYIMVHYFIQ